MNQPAKMSRKAKKQSKSREPERCARESWPLLRPHRVYPPTANVLDEQNNEILKTGERYKVVRESLSVRRSPGYGTMTPRDSLASSSSPDSTPRRPSLAQRNEELRADAQNASSSLKSRSTSSVACSSGLCNSKVDLEAARHLKDVECQEGGAVSWWASVGTMCATRIQTLWSLSWWDILLIICVLAFVVIGVGMFVWFSSSGVMRCAIWSALTTSSMKAIVLERVPEADR